MSIHHSFPSKSTEQRFRENNENDDHFRECPMRPVHTRSFQRESVRSIPSSPTPFARRKEREERINYRNFLADNSARITRLFSTP